MTTPIRHPGGRPPGFWRTVAGRHLIQLCHGNTQGDAEALWLSAVRIVADGNPVDSRAAKVAGVSRRTWARWRRFAAGRKAATG